MHPGMTTACQPGSRHAQCLRRQRSSTVVFSASMPARHDHAALSSWIQLKMRNRTTRSHSKPTRACGNAYEPPSHPPPRRSSHPASIANCHRAVSPSSTATASTLSKPTKASRVFMTASLAIIQQTLPQRMDVFFVDFVWTADDCPTLSAASACQPVSSASTSSVDSASTSSVDIDRRHTTHCHPPHTHHHSPSLYSTCTVYRRPTEGGLRKSRYLARKKVGGRLGGRLGGLEVQELDDILFASFSHANVLAGRKFQSENFHR